MTKHKLQWKSPSPNEAVFRRSSKTLEYWFSHDNWWVELLFFQKHCCLFKKKKKVDPKPLVERFSGTSDCILNVYLYKCTTICNNLFQQFSRK